MELMLKNILKYVSDVKPKKVIVDGTRVNYETAKTLANTISQSFEIPAYAKGCE